MITLLCGENDYERTKHLAVLRAGFDGRAERYDASELTRESLADLFAGQTLFALKRLVFIDDPSSYSELWQRLPEWAERLSDDTQLVLVEPKPDKRTSTFKWLKKHADVQEFVPLDERNKASIASWVDDYSQERHLALTQPQIRRLVERAGNDQWELAHAVDKLALAGEITDELIDDVVAASPGENVFALFEVILNGDASRLRAMLDTLRLTEDPFKLLGLISSQAMQVAVLAMGEANVSKVASDINAKSAYPLQKLAPFALRMSRSDVQHVIGLLAAADSRLKQSDADPWIVLESTMVQMASRFGSN